MNKRKDRKLSEPKYRYYAVPLKVSFLYAFLSCIWLLFSDQLLKILFINQNLFHSLVIINEYFYVFVSSLLIFALVSRGYIREKKQSERELGKSEQALKESIKELADVQKALDESSIIAITDRRGMIKYVNDKFCEISKYTRGELLGQDHRILNSGFHSKDFFKEMWKTIGTGNAWKGEIRNKAKDGTFYWVATTIVPFLNEKGKPYQYIAIRNDITEKKLAEVALKESEERYRKVVERSPLGIIIHQDGEVVFSNISASRIMKIDNGIGQSIFSFIHKEDRIAFKEKISNLAIGTEVPFEEMKLIRGDGIVIDAIVGGVAFNHEGKPSTMIMIRDITESKRIENELQESEERYGRLVNLSPEAIIIHSNGLIKYGNPACVKLLGASALEQLINQPINKFSHPHYRESVDNRIEKMKDIGVKMAPFEEKIISLDGRIVDVEVTGITINHEGKHAFLMIFRDITSRKKAEEALQQSEEQYRFIAENMTDLVRIVNPKGVVVYASPSHEHVLGYSPEVFEGNSAFEFIHPDDLEKLDSELNNRIMVKEDHTAEFRMKHAKGHWVWIEVHAKLVLDEEDNVCRIQMVGRDITERKMLEEKLSNMAFYDSLTGIPNRRLFQEKLKQTIKEAARYKRKFALLYMDIDKFKEINDTFGHDVGDELLKLFSERVQNCLRESDTIARQGGDEFTILLSEINEEKDALIIAERILASLQEPWIINYNELHTTSSIGVAFYPKMGTTFRELMKYADTALYVAKDSGRNNIKVYKA
ncbi:PAS/PAC sensor-containing diguanylate cyclase [Mycobacteroides abscessus subsp. abscessus]|nr:PAS/PAC sensor-containing diguanylate cyclase [Mycobacteroides abscessus subsp. abscessus]